MSFLGIIGHALDALLAADDARNEEPSKASEEDLAYMADLRSRLRASGDPRVPTDEYEGADIDEFGYVIVTKDR